MFGKTISWPRLVFGALLTTVLALSVHVVMLQNLNVPYPANFPRAGWPRLPDTFTSTLALIYLYGCIADRLDSKSLALRCGIVFVLLTTVKETLLRQPLMNVVDSTKFTIYFFVENIPRLIPLAAIAILVVLFAEAMKPGWRKWVGALVIAAFALLAVKPLADQGFAGVLQSISYLKGETSYQPPYDWHIEVPAYITFLEPVIGTLVMGALAWPNLSPRPAVRVLQFAVLAFVVKGPTLSPFVNILYAGTDPVTAVLSLAQFSFEAMTLGVFAALTLTFCRVEPREPAIALSSRP